MGKQLIFKFKTDISKINIAPKLNNPFSLDIPEIARIAAKEFQQFITSESLDWNHDFYTQKGKMFGVLVVEGEENNYGYLGTVSGNLPNKAACNKFTPSIFDASTDDFFIDKGMKELTEIGQKINTSNSQSEIITLTEKRKRTSIALQERLFESSRFLNIHRKEHNVLEIFKKSTHGNPPSAAGECTAPKLLQYAFKQQLKPIALAEFWWGLSSKSKKREHKDFYPACKSKCRPILEYMLDDMELYSQAITR